MAANRFPYIPFPENQVVISGGLELVTELYASGVRVFIDGQDISQFVFGEASGVIDLANNRFEDIDLSIWVKTPGQHSLVVTCEIGWLDVDARFETV